MIIQSIKEILRSLSDKLAASNIARLDAVCQKRVIGDVERIIKNHSLPQAKVQSLCGFASRKAFVEFYQESLAKGLCEEFFVEGKKHMYTLDNIHQLMDAAGMEKWSDTHNYTHIINVQNQKGGTGKTSFLVNVAVAIALMINYRPRVLIIDLDPQGSIRTLLAPDSEFVEQENGIDILTAVDLMLGDVEEDSLYQEYREQGYSHDELVRESVQPSHIPNVDLMLAFPEDERYSSYVIEDQIANGGLDALSMLKDKVVSVIEDDYDIIFIDTGPQNNPLVWSAVEAANGMITPVSPKALDWNSTSNFLQRIPEQWDLLPSGGENITWKRIAITNYEENVDDKIANNIRTDLNVANLVMANMVASSEAFNAAAANNCTVMDILKVEKLCKDKALDEAKASVGAVARELMAIMNNAEHEVQNNG